MVVWVRHGYSSIHAMAARRTDRTQLLRESVGDASSIGGAPVATMASHTVSTFQEITSKAAAATHAPTRLIDVRDPAEFVGELGHIPGAESVPLPTLPERSTHWDKDVELVLVCDSGVTSTLAAGMLVSAGFRHVRVMSGGMKAYVAARLPIARLV